MTLMEWPREADCILTKISKPLAYGGSDLSRKARKGVDGKLGNQNATFQYFIHS